MIKKLMTKKFLLILISIWLMFGIIFYWLAWRPARIYKACNEKVAECFNKGFEGKEIESTLEIKARIDYCDIIWNLCIREQGLKK